MALLLSFLLLLAAAPAAGVTVRVQQTPGGPQIHVDGQPIPPRFFFGVPSSGRVAAGETWSAQAFEFTPLADVNASGTLQFRFGETPGEVWVADARIADAGTGADVLPAGSLATPAGFAGAWIEWPPGEKNTVGRADVADGALHVSLHDPPAGGWPDYHLQSSAKLSFAAGHTYRVTFRVRATPAREIRPVVYQVTGGRYTSLGAPAGPFLAEVKLARAAGVRLISFAAPNGWGGTPQAADWGPLDDLCRQVIAADPEALLVPRVSVDAPEDWLRAHPDARMVFDAGEPGRLASVSSRAYRAAACAQLEALCRHLTAAFPDRFAGIHVCGQNSGEWFYAGAHERPLSGYDAGTRDAYRAWLAARGDPDSATAQPPGADERRAHPNGLLRDPARERRLVEFTRFEQREMADMVLALAAAARRGTAGQKLVLFFYGYQFEFPPLANGAGVSGHYALEPILRSKDIDILCGPVSYFDRQWLGTAPCMGPAESVRDAGILWLNEDDTRTYLDAGTERHVREGGLADLAQTRSVMLRNTSQAALRGFGTWWMDLAGTGWFDDAAIWDVEKRLAPVEQAMARRAGPFTPEIAAILGEDGMCHLTAGSSVAAKPLVYDARASLGRSGAPYGQYTLADVESGRVAAKLRLFLAAWSLTADERRALAASRPAGATNVWCWAPGYLSPDRADVSAMGDVTGFRHRSISPRTAEATPTEAGRGLGLTRPWGPRETVQPLFTVEATPEETLATFEDGSPAVAVRHGAHGLDVFVGVPALTPELVRALADLAGVHRYADGDAAVWAAEGFLSVQATKDGPVAIDTGRPGPVSDALTGADLGPGPRVTLPMKAGEVRVLRY